MSRDSSRSPLHLHSSRHADLLEDFTRPHSSPLSCPDDIFVPPQHQPLNPEDEDDVVPDQHAAFGIQRATQKAREPLWRDLGLEELMRRGPVKGDGSGVSGIAGLVRRMGGLGVGNDGGMAGLPR